MKSFSIQNPFIPRQRVSFAEKLSFHEYELIEERQSLKADQQCVQTVACNELIHQQHSIQPRASKKQVRNLFSVVNHVEQNYGSLLDEFPDDESQLAKILTLKASHPEQAASAAIKMGLGVEFVAMLRESMTFDLTSECWEAAMLVDDAASMLYLAQSDVPMDLAQVSVAASFKRGEHIHWLGHMLPRVAINAAVASGDLATVRILHETCKVPYNYKTMRQAAKHGHPTLIRHLHETGCPWEAKVAAIFARHNRLDCLAYASQTGCPLEVSTCRSAALQGHLACLEYAHKAGCPWDETVCAAAAANGHLQCLQYANKNGCPWDAGTMLKAIVGNHRDCLHYAYQNDCPGALRFLLQSGDGEFVCYVVETWFVRNTAAVYRVLAITTALSLLDKCFYKYVCVHWGVIVAQVMFIYDRALVLRKLHGSDRSYGIAAFYILIFSVFHIVCGYLLYVVTLLN